MRDYLAFNSLEFRLLKSILTKTNSNDILAQEAKNINWAIFLRMIVRYRLVEIVYLELSLDLSMLPTGFYHELSNIYRKSRFNSLAMAAETVRVARLFEHNKIAYFILKGIPLGDMLYGGITNRSAKDIDILVAGEDVDEAVMLLASVGYNLHKPEYKLTGFKREYYFANYHDIGLFNSERKVEIELHFKLEHFGIEFSKFLSPGRGKPINLNNSTINILDDDSNLLYLMLHGAEHAWSRLRWLHDIYLFMLTGKCDIDQIVTKATQIGVMSIVWQTLYLIREVYGYQDLATTKILAQPNKVGLRLAKLAIKFILADYEISANNNIFDKMFVLYRIYLFNLAPKGKKLSVLLSDFMKIDKTFSRVTLPNKLSWAYYIIYPFSILKYALTKKY